MKIRILDDAEADLVNSFRFYESQAEGIGDYFLDSLYSDIDSLRLFAGIHRQFLGFHQMLAKRFPYSVYYKVEDNTAVIYAVINNRRSPTWLVSRLSTEN